MHSQKTEWSFLNDIKSLSKIDSLKKIKCIACSIKTTGVNHEKDHIIELSAVEIENFKLTGRMFHIYIKPRVPISKNIQNPTNIRFYDYKDFHEYYNQDTKTQLENLVNFIGANAYIIAHNVLSDYPFLMNELKYWGLSEIQKERFRCTFEIANKIIELENEVNKNFSKLEDFCQYYDISEYPNEVYYNNLFDCVMVSKLFIRLYKEYNIIVNKTYKKNDIRNTNIQENLIVSKREQEKKKDQYPPKTIDKTLRKNKKKAVAYISTSKYEIKDYLNEKNDSDSKEKKDDSDNNILILREKENISLVMAALFYAKKKKNI